MSKRPGEDELEGPPAKKQRTEEPDQPDEDVEVVEQEAIEVYSHLAKTYR